MADTLNGHHIRDVLQYVKGRGELVLDEDFATRPLHLVKARAVLNKVLVVPEKTSLVLEKHLISLLIETGIVMLGHN